jgi:hypothetical protein
MKKTHTTSTAALEPVSRRAFLKSTSTAVVGGAALHALTVEALAISKDRGVDPYAQIQVPAAKLQSQRLLTGWEYRRGNLGGVWEAWRKVNDDANAWTAVELPHCFNAFDAVDPDGPYYQ